MRKLRKSHSLLFCFPQYKKGKEIKRYHQSGNSNSQKKRVWAFHKGREMPKQAETKVPLTFNRVCDTEFL